MTGSARTTAEELHARARAVWGDGFETASVARSQGWCSGYVYDAAKITLRADGGRVAVEGEMLDPDPVSLGRSTVTGEKLDAALRDLDARVRDRLPRAYLDAPTVLAGPGEPEGAVLELADVPGVLAARFDERVTDVRASADPARPGWTARLDGVLTFAVARDAQYGAYTAAILQGDRALGKLLGRRLIARHPDEASVRELLDLVDTWLRWRLVLDDQMAGTAASLEGR